MIKHRNEFHILLNSINAKVGVEIGVQKGEFSKHILENWNGDKLYMIDCWRPADDVMPDFKGDHNDQLNHIAHAFMNTYFFFHRCCIIKETSVEAAKLFKDESLDFIHIDAAHDYNNVMLDLKTWFPKVKKGGIFSGHDYLDGCRMIGETVSSVFGVKKAVDEFLIDYKINSTSEPYPTWWIIK